MASRTDRGVHARSNALGITSDLGPDELLRALNGIADEIYFARLAEVPAEFRVRSAVARWYRYWERPGTSVPERWAEVVPILKGTHDVRAIARTAGTFGPIRRTIDSVGATVERGWVVVDLRAPSFVWGMVRKIMTALRLVDAGRLSPSDLAAALHGEKRLPLALAEPERLVLWEVAYAIPWTHAFPGRTRQRERWEHVADSAAARSLILRALEVSARPTEARRSARPRDG